MTRAVVNKRDDDKRFGKTLCFYPAGIIKLFHGRRTYSFDVVMLGLIRIHKGCRPLHFIATSLSSIYFICSVC